MIERPTPDESGVFARADVLAAREQLASWLEDRGDVGLADRVRNAVDAGVHVCLFDSMAAGARCDCGAVLGEVTIS